MQPHGGSCMMFGCPNHRKMKNGPSFYKFPKNREICLKWLEKCKREDLQVLFAEKGLEFISKNYSLCSDHFTTKDFRNNNKPTQGVCPGAVPSVKIHGEEDAPAVIKAIAKMKIKLQCPTYFSSPSPSPSPESSPCQSPVRSKRKTTKTKKQTIQPETEMIKIEDEKIQKEIVIEASSTSPVLSQPDLKPVKPVDEVNPLKQTIFPSPDLSQPVLTAVKLEQTESTSLEFPCTSPDLSLRVLTAVKPEKTESISLEFLCTSPDLSQPEVNPLDSVDQMTPFKQTEPTSLEFPCTSPDLSQPEVKPVKPVDKVKSFNRAKPTSLRDYKELLKNSRLLAGKYRVRCKIYKKKILRMKEKIQAKKQEKL